MADTIRLPFDATETDILQALAELPGGGTIIFPESKTIAIRSGLRVDAVDRSITLDLNGSTLVKAGDVSVIVAQGGHDDALKVRLGVDAAGNSVATYAAPPADLHAGDWVKIISDDRLPGDRYEGDLTSRMGQAMQVLGVAGNTVTFNGALIDQAQYVNNIRASTYHSGEIVVKNGEIVGSQKHPDWDMPLVQLRSVVDARVENVTVRDNVGRGIGVMDGVNAEMTGITARNLLDGSPATLGIAVSSVSSTGTTVRGLYAENVTHAADDNAIALAPNAPYIERYGGDIGMSVADSVAVGARNFAWSWHSESVEGTFDNVMAFDSHGFLMARGVGGEMTGGGGAGNERGIILYEYGEKDGRNIVIDSVTLKETEQYSLFAANNPRNNTVSNSFFEAFGPGDLSSPLQAVVDATTFVLAGLDPNDVLTGTAGPDTLLGGKGADEISGGAGNDYIWGGAGEDRLAGGYGRDWFAFHSLGDAADTITDFLGGSGGDVLDLSVLAAKYGWKGGDPVASGYLRFVQSGDDVQVLVDTDGGGNNFTALATLKNIHPSQLGAGNLRLSLVDEGGTEFVADPETTLRGTEADDILQGRPETDHITAGGGADKLYAAARATLMEGGDGNDGLSGNIGDDVLRGGDGHDWMSGGDGQDRLYGDDGNDTLLGGAGADMLAGSAGYDTVSYANAAMAVAADLTWGGGRSGAAVGDRYSSVENLTGSDFDDLLTGSHVANVLQGGAGDDRLSGRGGADILQGGDGADWLDGGAWKDLVTGGSGSDSFYFGSFAQAGDTITDFATGVDHFVLSATGFGIDPDHGFSFVAGLEATSADPTVLYDRGEGRLLWDPDGAGAQQAHVLANLPGGTNVAVADFLIW
jgi:Ca2+-binding RTX toxin-like protein